MDIVLRVLKFSFLIILIPFSTYASESEPRHAKYNQVTCTETYESTTTGKKYRTPHDQQLKKSKAENRIKRHGHKHSKHKHHTDGGCHGKLDDTLTIALDGVGSGRVSSIPAGIFCENDCAEDYARNTQVLLSAQPYSGSVFTGWSGDSCSGVEPCSITLNANTTITANFNLIEPVVFNLITPYVNESDMREITDFFNAQYSNIPWGRIHDGLDIYPNGNLRAFQAACAGRVKRIYTFDEQVTLLIDCDSTYTIDYNFEAQAANTGQTQLDNILVTEWQRVAQGEIIGYLYSAENPVNAHVHFTLYNNAVPNCPAPHFTQSASDSILNLVAVAHQDVTMCLSGNVTPEPLLTPFLNASDMLKITAGFSSQSSLSPWDYAHDGIDIYPQGDLKLFQAACSGIVDTVELQQTGIDFNWQTEVAIVCNEYVADPDNGGYFFPLTTKYVFETMSNNPTVGQNQLDNIMLSLGQSVTRGDTIGYLNMVNKDSHVHFALLQFGQSDFQIYGDVSISLCPEAHFTDVAKDSILNLLHVAWPSAGLCYQN